MAVVKFRYGIVFCAINGGSSWCTYYRIIFPSPFSLPIAHYGQMEMTDILSGAIVAAIAIAAGMVAVWCLPRLHAMMHQMKKSGARARYWRIYSRYSGSYWWAGFAV